MCYVLWYQSNNLYNILTWRTLYQCLLSICLGMLKGKFEKGWDAIVRGCLLWTDFCLYHVTCSPLCPCGVICWMLHFKLCCTSRINETLLVFVFLLWIFSKKNPILLGLDNLQHRRDVLMYCCPIYIYLENLTVNYKYAWLNTDIHFHAFIGVRL